MSQILLRTFVCLVSNDIIHSLHDTDWHYANTSQKQTRGKKKQQIILLNIHLKTSILQYFTVGYREDLNLDGPHPLLGWKKS